MKGSSLVRVNVQKDQASIHTCYFLIVKKHLGKEKEYLNLFFFVKPSECDQELQRRILPTNALLRQPIMNLLHLARRQLPCDIYWDIIYEEIQSCTMVQAKCQPCKKIRRSRHVHCLNFHVTRSLFLISVHFMPDYRVRILWLRDIPSINAMKFRY